MIQIIIDSMKHYRICPTDDDHVEIHEFPEDCPGMGDREPFEESEGKLIARYHKDTEVQLLQTVAINKIGAFGAFENNKKIVCCDNLLWDIRGMPEYISEDK